MTRRPSAFPLRPALALALLPLVACSNPASSSSGAAGAAGGAGPDVSAFYDPAPDSCAYDCPRTAPCAEETAPYVCPSLGAWAAIPHADACAWDGSYPAPTAGMCTASLPTGEARLPAGKDPNDPTATILPDGRRLHPAGKEWVFTDVQGGMTSEVLAVPGTAYVLAVESGYGEHAVRAVDVTKLAAGADPVASLVKFEVPETLNGGLALAAPGRVFVAGEGQVYALTFDPATGALARDDASAIPLPAGADGPATASGVAASPDGTRLLVSLVDSGLVYVVGIAPGKGYGAILGKVDLGAQVDSFAALFDPNDPTGATAIVSLWANKEVVALDLQDPAKPAISATYATDKNPEGMAFLDARFFVVADANGDSLSLVDRLTGEVTSVPIDAEPRHGSEPTRPAFDPVTSRLYVALGGSNAIAAFTVDLKKAPPTVTRAGSLGTGWWPSGLAVRPGGELVVTTLRGHGGGPIPLPFTFPLHGDSDLGERLKGSIQAVAQPSAGDLAAGDAQVRRDGDPASLPGAPAVQCPAGANDFPIPETNTAGPSAVIDHVFFILRENKNFDGVLGDLGGGVDGDPALTLTGNPVQQEAIWHNFRQAARAFAVADNYYTDAVFSTQGHVLATYGRSSDFNERTWATSGARASSPRALPGGGVTVVGRPVEGSLFDWLYQNHVPYDILGEIDGQPDLPSGVPDPLDFHYPGVGQAISSIDLPKACYAAGRYRVACDVGKFVYQTLPNDHTLGFSAGRATPQTMCAVNDEATGILLDAISHSPFWKSSVVFITEDDPSQGSEHVDGHRTPFVVVSPWVKRGYVSKTHFDVGSVHRMYAHVFGLPYPNREVEGSVLPFDLFTSTPDYTPFTVTHRTWPLACGGAPGKHAHAALEEPAGPTAAEEELTALWDFTREDEQPGLGEQVWRAMRGEPLESLSPEVRARVARWNQRARARPDEDDR